MPIAEHLNNLTTRLISKSLLLKFRPSGRGHARVDLCDFFPNQNQNQLNNLPDDENRNLIASPEQFMETISANAKAGIALPPNMVTTLTRLKREGEDYHRATGLRMLCLGYPFVCVPRPNNASPIVAPLLLWKIRNIEVLQGNVNFAFVESKPALNFMFKAWTQWENNLGIEWNENEAAADITQLMRQLNDALKIFPANREGIFDIPHQIKGFPSQLPNDRVFMPCAVIGRARFNYERALHELEILRQMEERGEDLGLLSALVAGYDPNAANVSDIANVPIPPEPNRRIVTDTDKTQEMAVWQTRQQDIMLIKGPPGTGKSQTIVNLIADNASEGRQSVLICHKKSALDVVGSRLANFNNLFVQINSAIEEREAVIKKARNIVAPDTPGPVPNTNRENICRQIAQNTDYLDGGMDNNKTTYNKRGHLRAKWSRGHISPVARPYQAVVNEIGNIRAGTGNDLIADAKDLAALWASCNYENNVWRDISEQQIDRNALAALKANLEASAKLCREARNIYSQAQGVIARPHDTLLESGFINPHLHYFCGNESRKFVKILCQLILDTRRIFEEDAGYANVPPLWKDVYTKGENWENPFALYIENVGKIPNIQSIREKLKIDVYRVMNEHFPNLASKWAEILDTFIAYLDWRAMPAYDSPDQYHANCRQLRDSLKAKRGMDQFQIQQTFLDQVNLVNELKNFHLLRLRGGGGIPATSLRRLYDEGRQQIWNVFPILLTNPETAYRILPFEQESIDLVIVDEASQLFTADAMPIFYRASKIVICGDNMQMPPSDFFNVRRDDDADGGDDDDEDNPPPPAGADEYAPAAQGCDELLDAIELAANRRGNAAICQLGVHYRSRASELIAFSNHAFYGGKLQAAPFNPDDDQPPIELTHCPGHFEDGINNEEINAIIAKLEAIWGRRQPWPSVGIIVCNKTQEKKLSEAIENRDGDFKAKYHEASRQTEDGEDAGFFVRSIENVQGDERDEIILATTYGQGPRLYGPLSKRELGRRRLNVAITRAKVKMHVITSLNIGDISHPGEGPQNNDAAERKERWYLWMYLRYAQAVSDNDTEQAAQILQELNAEYEPHPIGRSPDSAFEIQVAKFLRDNGYHVDYQIGESGFRIDLGVKQSADSSRYLCGVECDGRRWHSSWDAKHNDIWRQGILEGKGWKILRVWSDEWFDATEDQRGQNLLAQIQELEQD